MSERFAQENHTAGWWTTLVRLGEPESSCCKVVGDCLKPVYGLFGAFHIARLRAIVGYFMGVYMSQLALSFKGVLLDLVMTCLVGVDVMKC